VAARAANPDAFIKTELRSVDELVRAVSANPRVRRNFARHFGIPESQVATYFRRQLVYTRLPAARTTTVYGVTRTGRIYSVRERLRKGTPVFTLRNGAPVLKAVCANPLVTRLPPMVATVPAPTPVVPRPAPVVAPPVIATPLTPPTTAFSAPLPVEPPEPVVDIVPVPLEGGELAPAPGAIPPPIVRGPPSRGGFPYWLLAAVPLAFIDTGGGDDNPPPPPPIPESQTWVLVGIGLPLLLLGARGRRGADADDYEAGVALVKKSRPGSAADERIATGASKPTD
jgi:hypothetical protein